MGWAFKSEAAPRLNAMLQLAQSEKGIPVSPAQVDNNHWLLNCANGTVDLKTGLLREHRREDLLTKISPTAYVPEARCPLFLETLDAIFGQDAEIVRVCSAIPRPLSDRRLKRANPFRSVGLRQQR